MIKLLHKVSFCRQGLLFSSSFAFADKSNVAFHKAVLASKVISVIRTSPLNEYRSSSFPSLNERIFQEISSYEEKQNDEGKKGLIAQAAQEVRNCFSNGVYIPLYMCTQTRYTEELKSYSKVKQQKGQIEILNVNQRKKKYSEEIDEQWLKQIKFRKLTFVPTYVITGQIFRSIIQEGQYNLLTGQYGSGKTYSFVLYTLLSEMIFRYRHQHCKQENDTLPEEIDFKIPKAIYMSMDFSQTDLTQDELKQQIRELYKLQCYELKDLYEKCDIFTLPKGLQLNYYLRLETGIIKLQDQINEAASAQTKVQQYSKLMRLLFFKIKQLREKERKNILTQYQAKQLVLLNRSFWLADKQFQSINLRYKLAKDYLILLNKTASSHSFSRLLFLSSVDIERDCLDSLNLMGFSKQASMKDRDVRLQFPLTLFGNVAIADACEIIAFNLKLHWQQNLIKNQGIQAKISLAHQQMLSKIKSQLQEAMREKSYGFILPLACSLYFKAQSKNSLQDKNRTFKTISLTELSSESLMNCNDESLKQKLHFLIKSIQIKSFSEISRKFTAFFMKQSENKQITQLKSLLAFKLWTQAEVAIRSFNQEDFIKDETTNQEKANQNTGLVGGFGVDLNGFEQLFQNEKSKNALSQMSFEKEEYQPYFIIRMNPEAIRSAFNANRGFYFQTVLTTLSPLFDYAKRNRATLGSFLSRCIRTILGEGSTTLECTLSGRKQALFYPQINGTASCFIPIPRSNSKSYQNFNFLKSFKVHLQTLEKQDKKRMVQWNLLLPLVPQKFSSKDNQQKQKSFLQSIIKKGISNYQVDKFSKLIDFSLCKYSENEKTFQIHLFDVTVENDPMDKCCEFIAEFINFKDKNELSFRFDQKEIPVKIVYNVITTETFDNKFKEYFEGKITSLEKENDKQNKKLKDNKIKMVQALKSFTFKDSFGACEVKGVNNQEYCLKEIRLISIAKDKLEFIGKQISLDNQMFERVVKQLKREDA